MTYSNWLNRHAHPGRRTLAVMTFVIIAALLAGGSARPSAAQGGTPAATMAATVAATQNSANGPQLFDGPSAFAFAKAQVDFGVRPTGSEALVKMGDYVISQFKSFGWTVVEQPFTLTVNGQAVKARNITAKIGIGSGPVLLIGAHYDTRLWADKDPDPAKRHDPILGANDGASGVAVMLELARVLGKNYKFNREIWLACFDAEDNGDIPGWNDWSLGASYYADHLEKTPADMILLDMIGDKDLNIMYEMVSMQKAADLMKQIWDTGVKLGYGDSWLEKNGYSMSDDHIPFINKGIRSVDIIDFDYPYHHTLADTLDKISPESLEKVGRTLQAWMTDFQIVTVATP